MYCSKCGKELKDTQQFCPNCGTKAGTAESPKNSNITAESIKNKALEMKTNIISGAADLGKSKILLFADIALIVLSLIFSCTPTFKASSKVSTWFGISQSYSVSMFYEMSGIMVFFILCYIVSIAALLYPLLLKKAWNTKLFLPAKITSIMASAWFLLILILGISESSSMGYLGMINFGLTATGWFFVLTTLGVIILSFKITIDLKKAMQNTVASAQRIVPTDNAQ